MPAGPGYGCQPSDFAAVGHHVREAGAAQRGQRVRAPARALEDVPARVDRPLDVAGLAGDAGEVLVLVVVRLELGVVERPVDRGRVRRDRVRPVALARLGRDLEVPRAGSASSGSSSGSTCRRPRSSSARPRRAAGSPRRVAFGRRRRDLEVRLEAAHRVADVVRDLVERVVAARSARGPASIATTFMPAFASGQTAVPPAAPSADDDDVDRLSASRASSVPPRRAAWKSGIEYVDLRFAFGTTSSCWSLRADHEPRAREADELPADEVRVPAVRRVAEHALHGVRADHLEDGLRVRARSPARRARFEVHVGEDGVLLGGRERGERGAVLATASRRRSRPTAADVRARNAARSPASARSM